VKDSPSQAVSTLVIQVHFVLTCGRSLPEIAGILGRSILVEPEYILVVLYVISPVPRLQEPSETLSIGARRKES